MAARRTEIPVRANFDEIITTWKFDTTAANPLGRLINEVKEIYHMHLPKDSDIDLKYHNCIQEIDLTHDAVLNNAIDTVPILSLSVHVKYDSKSQIKPRRTVNLISAAEREEILNRVRVKKLELAEQRRQEEKEFEHNERMDGGPKRKTYSHGQPEFDGPYDYPNVKKTRMINASLMPISSELIRTQPCIYYNSLSGCTTFGCTYYHRCMLCDSPYHILNECPRFDVQLVMENRIKPCIRWNFKKNCQCHEYHHWCMICGQNHAVKQCYFYKRIPI